MVSGKRTRRETTGAIRVVRRTNEASLLAQRELRHTLIPAANKLADADARAEWLTTVARRVELAAVRLERADIVHVDRVAGLGKSLAVARSDVLNLDTHCSWLVRRRGG